MRKQTTRTYILSVPTANTTTTMVRTYVRATDGTDYPQDREIEVAAYAPAEVSYVLDVDVPFADCTEQWVLAQFPAGTQALECRDVVTLLPDA